MKKSQNVKYYVAGAAGMVTFLVYLSALRNDFVDWDDNRYIINNFHIRSFDAAFFKWAFFDFYDANWHPLTWISHALDYAVWGLNPLGHHLTNIILHAVNTVMVVLLMMRLVQAGRNFSVPALIFRGGTEGKGTFEKEGSGGFSHNYSLIAAATTGLLFGLHPLHVESVAWISERKDLLCALFYLLSIMMYLSYSAHETRRAYFLTLSFFILSLMSKPMAVSLPFVLLILDWYPYKKIQSFNSFWPAFIEKLPFIALSLISSVLTILAQRAGEAMEMMAFLPLSTRLLVAAKALLAYLWKTILPLNLSPYYPYPWDISFASPEYLCSLLLVAGITIICLVVSRKRPLFLAIWGYYITTLFPVLGVVQVGGEAMADRYIYLSSLGPFLVIGIIAAGTAEKMVLLKNRGLIVRLIGIAAAILIIVSLSNLTIKQIGIWKDGIALWSHVIEIDPGHVPLAYNYRGAVFHGLERFDKAIEDYNKAIDLAPTYAAAFSNRGEAFMKLGQLDKAARDFDKALALKPYNPRAYNEFVFLGLAYVGANRQSEAIVSYDKAIAIDPKNPIAYINRAIANSVLRRYDKALKDFDEAVARDPNRADAHYNRGIFYLLTGDRERAAADYRKACILGDAKGCDALKHAANDEKIDK